MEKLNILIVEDNPEWLECLKSMYMELFLEIPIFIETSSNKEDALKKLPNCEWGIVSLDVNLHGDKTPVANMTTLEKYLAGQDVIHRIAEEKMSRFVVVITSIAYDKKIMALCFDDAGELQTDLLTIPNELKSLFPMRSEYIQKIPAKTVRQNIAQIKGYLKKAGILDLMLEACGFLNKLERVSEKIWEVVFDGETVPMEHQDAFYYLPKLLNNPGKSISIKELIALKPWGDGKHGSKQTVFVKEENGNKEDVDNTSYCQDNTKIDRDKDHRKKGIKLTELSEEDQESISNIFCEYRQLVDRLGSCSEGERLGLINKVDIFEKSLRQVYCFSSGQIISLRTSTQMPGWASKKLAAKVIDVNKKERDVVYNAIKHFREKLPISFNDLSDHLNSTSVSSSLSYGDGYYTYTPKSSVKWLIKIDPKK